MMSSANRSMKPTPADRAAGYNLLSMRKTSFILLFLLSLILRPEARAQDSLHYRLPAVLILGERTWDNDTDRYHYNQTRYYIQTILPYVEVAMDYYIRLMAWKAETKPSPAAFRRRVKQMEKELESRYKDEIKNLNTTQAELLIKLLARQTGTNLADLLQELKSGFFSLRWQAWGRLNGIRLNEDYDPDKESMIEQILYGLDWPQKAPRHPGWPFSRLPVGWGTSP